MGNRLETPVLIRFCSKIDKLNFCTEIWLTFVDFSRIKNLHEVDKSSDKASLPIVVPEINIQRT